MALLNFPSTKLNGDPLQNGDEYIGGNGVTYVYNNGKWIGHSLVLTTSTVGGGGSIIQSASAPLSPSTSTLWYDTVGGRMYVYYDSAWIDAAPETYLPTYVSAFIDDAGYITATNQLVNGSSVALLDTGGNFTAPGIISVNGFSTSGTITIPNSGVSGGIVTQNGLGNIYFETDNSLQFIITGTYQHSFNPDGSVAFGGGYVFPGVPGTSGQVLVFDPDHAGNHNLSWQNLPTAVSSLTNDLEYLTSSTIGQYIPASTTSTLVNGDFTIKLGADGVLTMPDGNASGTDGRIDFNFEGYNWGRISSHNRQVYIHSVEDNGNNPAEFGKGAVLTELSVGLDVSVSTNVQGTGGSAYNWNFGTDGTLTLPDNNAQIITPSAGSGNKNIDIFTNNFDGNGVEVFLQHDSGVGIYTDNANYGWFFDKTGKLTLPGDINFNYGASIFEGGHDLPGRSWRTGLNIVGGTGSGNEPVRIYPYGTDGKGFGMGTVNVLSTGVEIYGSNQGTNPGVKWTFGSDSGLTFPDTTVQTTAWNDQAFMASMASYDGEVAFNTATVGIGGLTVNGPVSFNGPFTFQGTATVINSNSGTFYGDIQGVGALYAGVAGFTQLPATVFQSAADVNDYIQNNFQNLNHGVTASTEWVATNDTGNDSNNYIDIGIAGHGWDGTQSNSVGTAAGPSDSWVYTQGTVSSNEGGNLILGTIKDGKAVKILAGSAGASSIVATFDSTGLTLNTGSSIVFADGSIQTTAVTTGGTVVLGTLNVTNVSATNITINGQTILPGVTRITAGTGTHVSTTTGALTLWTDTFNTGTLVAQAVTALSIPYANVTGTPNLSGYATQSAVSTLQITVNNLTNTVSTLTTTATVNALIANSLTNVVKTIVAGTGTAVSVSGNTVTIWTTASGGVANLNNLSGDISFSTAGVGAPTFNTTSTGVKISYYPSESATMVDYATGIESGALWNSIPSATNNFAFKWYGGTSTVATLNGLGTLTATKFVGDGSSLTNVTVNAAGSILGTGTNMTLVAGSYSYLFDNTGTFTMPANGDIVMTGTNATIQAGGAITAGYNSPSGGTAFIAGNAAVNNIALGYQPTSGAANMAIRDLSTVSTYMYFDAASNTTSTNSQFVFRSSSAYTTWAKIDQYGVNLPTRPAFRVYGAGTTGGLTTTQNTNGVLNGNNFAVDYQQGTALSTSTGIFTAPVAGLYSIHLSARVVNNTSPSAQVAVIKNYAGTSSVQAMWETPANATVNHFGVSTIARLAVGDTLVVKVTLGSITFDGNDNWSVAYIG